ncbi:MAG: hypothetical protein PUC44_00095 [Eubacteriales bacterium]|nr:hypothetical protein [Eubacteriales bacterium]
MRKMSKGARKAGIAGLAAVLCVTTMVSVSVLGTPKSYAAGDASKQTKTQKEVESTYPNLISQKDYSGINAKDETTYVVMDADGNVTDTAVSSWLRNGKDSDKIKDYSTLKNIKNTSGKEKYTRDGNTLVWNAKGNDITYQGTPTEDVPVTVKVSYYLDGQKVSAKTIAGKSGKVEIHFDYTVNKKENVSVDGKSYSIDHPYTMASGLVLDNSNFKDVTISNGKAVNDGDKTVCLGIAFPGLADSLKLNATDVNIPESVVVTATAENFKLDGTYTVALSEALGSADLSTGSLNEKVEQLKSGIQQLDEASNELVSGAKTLKEGSSELASGTKEILQGAEALNSGLSTLSQKGSTLSKATDQLKTSVFSMATKELQNQLKESGMSEEEAAKYTLSPNSSSSNYYKTVLNGVTSAAVSKAESTLRGLLSQQGVTDTSQQNIILARAYNTLASSGKTNPTEAELQTAIVNAGTEAKTAQAVSAAVSNSSYQQAAAAKLMQAYAAQGATFDPSSAEGQQQIAVVCTEMMIAQQGGASNPAGLDLQTLSNYQSKATELLKTAQIFQGYVSAETNPSADVRALAAMAAATKSNPQETAKALKSAETQLDQVIQYTEGVKAYIAGVNSAYAGSEQLVSGMKKLSSGAEQLDEGVGKLDAGIQAFDEDGIDKLIDSMNNNQLEDLISRAKALQSASNNPVFIGGVKKGMEGDSKIIFKTASIKNK